MIVSLIVFTSVNNAGTPLTAETTISKLSNPHVLKKNSTILFFRLDQLINTHKLALAVIAVVLGSFEYLHVESQISKN